MNDDLKKQTPASGPQNDKGQESPSFNEKRKEKIESFQLHFTDEALNLSGEPVSNPAAPAITPAVPEADGKTGSVQPGVLNSFSQNTAEQVPNTARTPEEKKAERAAIKAEKKRKKQKAKKNGCLFKIIWMIMVVLVSVVLAQYILVGVNDMLAVNRTESAVQIDIPKDSSINDVSRILVEKGIIKRSDFFKLYAQLTKRAGNFSKGTYEMKTNMDYEAIINFLQSQSNRKDIVTVTFTEGMNLMEYADLLEKSKVCSAKDFLEACNSDAFDEEYSFIAAIGNKADRYYKMEGYLFPDTYQFYEDEDPVDTISRMLNNYEKKIVKKQQLEGHAEKVSIEDLAREKGLAPEELITLASMVQAEAADVEDMSFISSIFLNRLNADVDEGVSQLNSDPTQFYPYKSKDAMPEGFESKYDTYVIQGLPAGPICNPGMDAINATLNPKDRDYLYFCHAKDGTAYYAKTLPEHERNLVKAGLK